jgi:hypothetical protein
MDEQTRQTPGTPGEPPKDDLQSLLKGRPSEGRSRNAFILAAIVLVVVGAIGGLFVGKSMASDSQQGPFPGSFGPNGPSGTIGTGFPGGNTTIGTITNVDGDTITIQTANGDTISVDVGSDTTIQVTQTGSLSDLRSGDTIVVAGTENDGSIDADSINEGGLGLTGGGPGAGGSG